MLKTVERSFPENFLEMGLKSIEEISGENIKVENQFEEKKNVRDNFMENFEYALPFTDFDKRLVKVTPSTEKIQIVGVDLSSRKIGVSKNGLLCAFRGTVVWRDEYCYRYKRFGPFLFHLNNRTLKNEITLHSQLQPSEVMSSLQVSMERELQKFALQQFTGSLVLIDGSLSPMSITQQTVRIARRNHNKILAIAKRSKIFEGRYPLYSPEGEHPYILHLEDPSIKIENSFTRTGWIFIAKLCKNGLGFRLDVDGSLSFEEAVCAVEMLMGNDLLLQGYPETLRMAHTLSIFTPLEILALQRFIAENYHVRIQKIENMRRKLFGPFEG